MAEEIKQETAAAVPQPAAPAEEKKKPAKVEIPMNCGSCKKPIHKKLRYYRNMKFFCNKKCWAKLNAEQKKVKEQPAAAAA